MSVKYPEQSISKGTVVFINTQDFSGGAAMSTYRMGKALQHYQYITHTLTGRCLLKNGYARYFSPQANTALEKITRAEGLQYYHLQGSHKLIRHPLVRRADILHLQNLHGDFFNPYSIPALSRRVPTVWTLRDMWAITGHCAHAMDCPRWETGCGNCPDITIYPAISKDATARLWQDKQTIYKHSRLWITCPSQWLADKVQRSLLRMHPVTTIMNAVDTTVFYPQDKQTARQRMHLPEDAVIMGISAQGGLNNFWKGGAYALEAARALHQIFPSLIFLAVGGVEITADYVHCLPHINTEEKMALYHSCLDFTLFTSIADTCPLVLIESLSCGVPVVGFATGGAPEIVREGIDGFMVTPLDLSALVQAAATFVSKPKIAALMGKRAVAEAKARFSLERLGADYDKLYDSVRASQRPFPPPLPAHLVPPLVRTREYERMEATATGVCND
jgi:glycosyltransferase involved in cell wall biosynthesis